VFHFKEEFVIRANWIIEEKIVVEWKRFPS
jgi:hypothetical protein